MDNIMIGDLVVLWQDVEHPLLGTMPCYTLACALKRNEDGSWSLGVLGFGAVDVPRSAFRLYQEKSIMRHAMVQKRDMHMAGHEVDEWFNPL